MFIPKQAKKEPSENVRVSFSATTMQALRDIAGETKTEVRQIVVQMVDYAIASMTSSAQKHRGRKPVTKVDHREADK